MLEERLSRREDPAMGSPDGGLFAMHQPDDLVMVTSGPYDGEEFPVAGLTVAAIRDRLADRLDLDPAAQAVVDGHDAADETVLVAGQVLSFVQHAGEKGATGQPRRGATP